MSAPENPPGAALFEICIRRSGKPPLFTTAIVDLEQYPPVDQGEVVLYAFDRMARQLIRTYFSEPEPPPGPDPMEEDAYRHSQYG